VKPKSTWILIADGKEARILEALGDGRGYHEHTVRGGHRLPSGVETAPPHRPIDERPSGTRALEALFARQLGAMLASYLRNNAFDRLVLVAPAAMLGELRKMLSPAVREKIIVEIEKDLTGIPSNEISRYLDDVVAL
jgi:protein required for attachment to host cells